jgi:hypothetical protein
MIFKDELDRAGPIVDRVNAAIRDNPLAAGLIGASVAWMLMGGAKGFVVAGSAAATAGNAVASGVAQAGSATTARLKSAASDVAGSVASLVPDISAPDTDKAFEAVADAGTAVSGRITSAAAAGQEYGAAIQSRLSETLEQQPSVFASGGLVANASAQVIDQRYTPIPGLYAAGNNAVHTEYGVGYQAGFSLGSGMTFGYLAARHMAGLN